MNDLIPPLVSEGQILAEVNGCLGLITLNRPQALNALSLAMIRDLTTLLTAWAADARIQAVVVLVAGREGKPAAFCAGGDIRFFHQAALAGDPAARKAVEARKPRLGYFVPDFANPTGVSLTLAEGHCLAIEPMFTLGSPEVGVMDDEWTVVTLDGSLAAHFEDSVAIGPGGAELLTRP